MRGAGTLLLLVCCTPLGCVRTAVAQATAGDKLRFTLDRTGAAASRYSIELDRTTRKGVFVSPGSDTAEPAGAGKGAQGQPGEKTPGVALGALSGVPLGASADIVKQVFAAGPLVESGRCDAHRKGIAQTGTKTLRLVRAGTVFECSYNYAEDERVNTATSVFEALAQTMDYGARLARELRFDRLGLDAEMDSLQSALHDGRALEVGNIASVLEGIQNDDRVMDRVRRKAAHLLEGAGVPAASSPEDRGLGLSR